MLDAFAVIFAQIFLDLAIRRHLVDRDADLAVRAGQRAGDQAR